MTGVEQRYGEVALHARCSECQGCWPLTSQQCLIRQGARGRGTGSLRLAVLEGSIPRFVIILASWDRVSSVLGSTHLFTDLHDPHLLPCNTLIPL